MAPPHPSTTRPCVWNQPPNPSAPALRFVHPKSRKQIPQLWCILEADARTHARAGKRTTARARAILPTQDPRGGQQVLETTIFRRPARHGSFRWSDRVLRMQVNGRLTAPPQFEAALVTNSVFGIASKGRASRSSARGTTLAQSSLGSSPLFRLVRRAGQVFASAHRLGKFYPVSAAHNLSTPLGGAARC